MVSVVPVLSRFGRWDYRVKPTSFRANATPQEALEQTGAFNIARLNEWMNEWWAAKMCQAWSKKLIEVIGNLMMNSLWDRRVWGRRIAKEWNRAAFGVLASPDVSNVNMVTINAFRRTVKLKEVYDVQQREISKWQNRKVNHTERPLISSFKVCEAVNK